MACLLCASLDRFSTSKAGSGTALPFRQMRDTRGSKSVSRLTRIRKEQVTVIRKWLVQAVLYNTQFLREIPFGSCNLQFRHHECQSAGLKCTSFRFGGDDRYLDGCTH